LGTVENRRHQGIERDDAVKGRDTLLDILQNIVDAGRFGTPLDLELDRARDALRKAGR